MLFYVKVTCFLKQKKKKSEKGGGMTGQLQSSEMSIFFNFALECNFTSVNVVYFTKCGF